MTAVGLHLGDDAVGMFSLERRAEIADELHAVHNALWRCGYRRRFLLLLRVHSLLLLLHLLLLLDGLLFLPGLEIGLCNDVHAERDDQSRENVQFGTTQKGDLVIDNSHDLCITDI